MALVMTLLSIIDYILNLEKNTYLHAVSNASIFLLPPILYVKIFEKPINKYFNTINLIIERDKKYGRISYVQIAAFYTSFLILLYFFRFIDESINYDDAEFYSFLPLSIAILLYYIFVIRENIDHYNKTIEFKNDDNHIS
jgi:hypothetical protein